MAALVSGVRRGRPFESGAGRRRLLGPSVAATRVATRPATAGAASARTLRRPWGGGGIARAAVATHHAARPSAACAAPAATRGMGDKTPQLQRSVDGSRTRATRQSTPCATCARALSSGADRRVSRHRRAAGAHLSGGLSLTLRIAYPISLSVVAVGAPIFDHAAGDWWQSRHRRRSKAVDLRLSRRRCLCLSGSKPALYCAPRPTPAPDHQLPLDADAGAGHQCPLLSSPAVSVAGDRVQFFRLGRGRSGLSRSGQSGRRPRVSGV